MYGRAGWQPEKAGCSRPVGLQPPRRPLEAERWQLLGALLLLEGQADWGQEVRRPLVVGRLALVWVLALVLVLARLALVRVRVLVLVWVPALVLARLVRQLELALVLRLVLVLQLA